MDLGSGWGTFLVPLAHKFPQHKFVGIEKAFLPYWVTKIRTRKLKNVSIYQEDFFKSDISDADIVILFLLQHIMPKIQKKCFDEMKKGKIIFVNRFPFTKITPVDKEMAKNRMFNAKNSRSGFCWSFR